MAVQVYCLSTVYVWHYSWNVSATQRRESTQLDFNFVTQTLIYQQKDTLHGYERMTKTVGKTSALQYTIYIIKTAVVNPIKDVKTMWSNSYHDINIYIN